jgi:hypothetical protein
VPRQGGRIAGTVQLATTCRPTRRTGRRCRSCWCRRLEAEARAAGAALLRIETGLYQAEALRFYEAAGFRRCGPFGPYADMPPHAIETSLFYEKAIESNA